MRVVLGVVLALVVSLGVPPAHAADTFIDDDRSIHARDIEAIAAEGITRGCDPPYRTRFCPERDVTRGEMAAFLRRALDLAPSTTDHFDDDDGHRFEADIDALAAAGITRGCRQPPDPRYCPDRTLTRAEMAAFLTRALGLPRPVHGVLHHTPTEPFTWSSAAVAGTAIAERMTGVSWHPGCPVGLEDLRYLRLAHLDHDGRTVMGELVVHRDVVSDVVTAFRRLHELGFPITRMRLVSDFDGSDDRSMRFDNTSAYNCRRIAGTTRWSQHAYGRAVDINPLRNPWVRGDDVDPADGATYADRTWHRPGMLLDGSAEVRAWTDLGWGWGGHWRSSQDHQHVSRSGT